jgi:nitroreductase
VDPIFPDRWSPRAFQPDPIPEPQIRSLLEAARWAPSCYNEQPWLFCLAATPDARERVLAALVERNRLWARRAPLLILLAARRTFTATGKLNRHAGFDAGAAWLSLALQARRLGLHAHAMAGFNQDRALAAAGLDRTDWDILAAIAVGRHGDPADLPDDLRALETPNTRKPLADIIRWL